MGLGIERKSPQLSCKRLLLSIIVFLLMLLRLSLFFSISADAQSDDTQVNMYSQTGDSTVESDDHSTAPYIIPVILIPEMEENAEKTDYIEENSDSACVEEDFVSPASEDEIITTNEQNKKFESEYALHAEADISATKSVTGTVVNSSYDMNRVRVSLSGYDETISSVKAVVFDENGNRIADLYLNALNAWTAVCYPEVNSSYSIFITEILDQTGTDVSRMYHKDISEGDSTLIIVPDEQKFVQKDLLEYGIYVFQIGNTDSSVLLSTDSIRTKAKSNSYYYYPLVPTLGTPEDSGTSARWSVNRYGSGFSIASMNSESQYTGYLTAGISANKAVFIAMENPDAYSFYSDDVFYAYPDGGSQCWLAFSGETFSATHNSASAVTITPWRLENVSYHIIELPFQVNLSAVPQTTSVTIRIRIEGNIADRTLLFPFHTTGSTPASFTIGHNGEQVIDHVTLNSDFTLQFDANSYAVTSNIGIISENRSLTVQQIQEGTEIELVFRKEGSIETGLHLDDIPVIIIFFVCIVTTICQFEMNQKL